MELETKIELLTLLTPGGVAERTHRTTHKRGSQFEAYVYTRTVDQATDCLVGERKVGKQASVCEHHAAERVSMLPSRTFRMVKKSYNR